MCGAMVILTSPIKSQSLVHFQLVGSFVKSEASSTQSTQFRKQSLKNIYNNGKFLDN